MWQMILKADFKNDLTLSLLWTFFFISFVPTLHRTTSILVRTMFVTCHQLPHIFICLTSWKTNRELLVTALWIIDWIFWWKLDNLVWKKCVDDKYLLNLLKFWEKLKICHDYVIEENIVIFYSFKRGDV